MNNRPSPPVSSPQQQLLRDLSSGARKSGAELAGRQGVTRAAVWKQVQALRERGLPVQGHGRHGYQLPWPVQMLDAQAIRRRLDSATTGRLAQLEVLWEIDSTSSELQRRGSDAADGTIVLAETQSAGRGRRGRVWLSPPGTNLYMSCLKRFDDGFASLSGLSLAVGVMVLRALRSLGISGVGLKWPNDVLADQGKLAGILVELAGEYQGPSAAVIGIGLNLRLTPELRQQAAQPTCDLADLLEGQVPDRNDVAARLIGTLLQGLAQFEHDGFAPFADEYMAHDRLRGQALHLTGAHGEIDGVGAGVDQRGALLVHTDVGLVAIDSADVTVRRT